MHEDPPPADPLELTAAADNLETNLEPDEPNMEENETNDDSDKDEDDDEKEE